MQGAVHGLPAVLPGLHLFNSISQSCISPGPCFHIYHNVQPMALCPQWLTFPPWNTGRLIALTKLRPEAGLLAMLSNGNSDIER